MTEPNPQFDRGRLPEPSGSPEPSAPAPTAPRSASGGRPLSNHHCSCCVCARRRDEEQFERDLAAEEDSKLALSEIYDFIGVRKERLAIVLRWGDGNGGHVIAKIVEALGTRR